MYGCFGLVLMVTHACNLRCRYCYTGAKTNRSMPIGVAKAAIDRAVRSISPGGTLELGFFGGEPLLRAELIAQLIGHASESTVREGLLLQLSMTTNGTVAGGTAWKVMTSPGMHPSISHDGLPRIHDRHRVDANGDGTSSEVLATIGRLKDEGHDPHLVMVVRPDNVESFPDGVAFLREQGVRHIVPSLDVWAEWSRQDAEKLQQALVRCADTWHAGLPHNSISWFDEKAARLAGVPSSKTARCGFGDGEIAVAPSGNLYPCERLIGTDTADNPMRLPGHALDGSRFDASPTAERSGPQCSACSIAGQCNTTCRCSNYIRSGRTDRPDGLLCLLDSVCYRETARVLRKLPTGCEAPLSSKPETRSVI
jgi:uncharacterized protein